MSDDSGTLYVALSKTTGKYYRGARLWRWTRFVTQAAFLKHDHWKWFGEQNRIDAQDMLLFKAPPDRWWRGRNNGQRIVGVSAKVAIDVTQWLWLPVMIRHCGAIHWLCFRTWWQPEYADD